ncbi:Retrovirus-related Pol polyprotein from transposon 412 [Araneus ventricosus]|uniref:RNA-directed DNA polymerase n=1 Tax=Araneus ventricosus TaxID=182803 RepID=A0A4Y2UCP6_ARAVE|nr:Retrovirus-related Pol polyprotein from transposon 412 [Araneus ventricosus]
MLEVFLGCVNYYRKFIPDYGRRSIHMTNLTKENNKFIWSKEAEKEFNDLKKALVQRPCSSLPDMNRDFLIYIDASSSCLGGVLAQLDENDFPKPIAFASRKLKPNERIYSTTEREILSIVFTVGYFRPYLYGLKFTIYILIIQR